MKAEETDVCNVCFVKPHKLLEYSRIIQCSGCRSTCHKSCYDPSITGAQFLCDSCQYSKNKKEFCFICGNKGLLKQVDDKFAHPICLLFSPQAIVVEYKTLKFTLLNVKQNSKKGKKFKCQLCQKPGNVEKCFFTDNKHHQCQHNTHIYCLWINYSTQKGCQWNFNTVVDGIEYSFYYDKKIKQYLLSIGSGLYDYLDSFSGQKTKKIRQFQLVCPSHVDNLFQCCMQPQYFDTNQEVDFIQCDQCFKWYHQNCLDRSSLPQAQGMTFVCEHCQQFIKLIQKGSKKQIYLKKFPRLNICELIHIQKLFEEKEYTLSNRQTKLMFKLPIEPSLCLVQQNLKLGIQKKLKTANFEALCKLNLDLRMQKKQFKSKFTSKFQKALIFLIQKKSLYDFAEQRNQSTDLVSKQQEILEEQETKKLHKWIFLLKSLAQLYNKFEEDCRNLVTKLQKWLNSLTKKETKNEEQQSQQSEIRETKTQFKSSKKIILKRQTKKQVKSQQISQESEESTSKIDQKRQISFIRKSQTSNNLKSEEEMQSFESMKEKLTPIDSTITIFFDKQKQIKILELINTIQKKINVKRTKKELLYKKLCSQIVEQKDQQNKSFYLDIILNTKVSPQSTLKCLLLQSLFQSFLKIKENAQADNPIINQHEDETIFEDQSIQMKNKAKKKNIEKKIKFLQKFSQKLLDLYYQSSDQVKKQFKTKIQLILSQLADLVDKLEHEESQADRKPSFDETLSNLSKNPKQSFAALKLLKHQVKQTFDPCELRLMRLSMQKKKVYLQIKKVQFTRYSSNQIGLDYENHCKSSSSFIQPFNQSQKSESSHNQPKLRTEILEIQKRALEVWIKMFGLVFQLAHQIECLGKQVNENKIVEQTSRQSAQCFGREPLQIIKDALDINYSQRSADFKKSIAQKFLLFFYKVYEAELNWRIFHNSVVDVMQKIGLFCIQLSSQDILFWGQKDQTFMAMKIIYKCFRKPYLFNQNSQSSEVFERIWQIFETDQLFEEYLEENKNVLFNDPEFTQLIYLEKIPETIRFYKEIGLNCRVKKLKRIKIWMFFYFKSLQKIGFYELVDKHFKDSPLRNKYRSSSKITFNQLCTIASELQRMKFPKCDFLDRVFEIFEKASKIETQLQQYFITNNVNLQLSFEVKQQFIKVKNIERNCLEYNEEFYSPDSKISSESFFKLMNTLSANETSSVISFQLEKREILINRDEFEQLIVEAQRILMDSNTSIQIKKLNQLFFDILSYPFYYVNLSYFHLFILERVERQTILSAETRNGSKLKNLTFLDFQKQYQAILDSLQPKEKASFNNRLTRDEIVFKLEEIKNTSEYKQFAYNQNLKLLRDKILSKVKDFDQIKESFSKLQQKINENYIFEFSQLQVLDKLLSQYKQQKVFELNFELLYSQVEIYKLSFSPIPNSPLDMKFLLEQFKTLKQSFKTKGLKDKIKELERKIQRK